jgi:hypothetical protein
MGRWAIAAALGLLTACATAPPHKRPGVILRREWPGAYLVCAEQTFRPGVLDCMTLDEFRQIVRGRLAAD